MLPKDLSINPIIFNSLDSLDVQNLAFNYFFQLRVSCQPHTSSKLRKQS